MRTIAISILVFVLLSACQPSPELIAAAIAKTQTAEPTATTKIITATKELPTNTPFVTQTPKLTNTPTRTATPKPSPTSTEVISYEERREEVAASVVNFLEVYDEIESVNYVRFEDNGGLELEFKTIFSSQDNQPAVSFDIVKLLSEVFAKYPESDLLSKTGGTKFTLAIVSYSESGDYRYQSITDYETLVKLYKKSIGYEEWISLAQASFR